MTQPDLTERPAGVPSVPARPRTPSSSVATLVSDEGRTSIADGVVAKIAGLAAREIDGVYQLVESGASGALSGLAQRVTGTDAVTRGVTVEVGQREAAVDLKMITIYGASIPDVAQAVRQNIITRVREMTGLMVKEVNIDVTDLYFPGEEQTPPVKSAPPARRVE